MNMKLNASVVCVFACWFGCCALVGREPGLGDQPAPGTTSKGWPVTNVPNSGLQGLFGVKLWLLDQVRGYEYRPMDTANQEELMAEKDVDRIFSDQRGIFKIGVKVTRSNKKVHVGDSGTEADSMRLDLVIAGNKGVCYTNGEFFLIEMNEGEFEDDGAATDFIRSVFQSATICFIGGRGGQIDPAYAIKNELFNRGPIWVRYMNKKLYILGLLDFAYGNLPSPHPVGIDSADATYDWIWQHRHYGPSHRNPEKWEARMKRRQSEEKSK